MAATPLTLERIHELALRWGRSATWERLLETANSWGPAHELAHMLIEPQWRHDETDYGRCGIYFCSCRGNACTVAEAAAMMISHRLVTTAGREDLVQAEIEATTDYDLIDASDFRRGKALLKRKGLWPVPRTVEAIERALRRRLRHPPTICHARCCFT